MKNIAKEAEKKGYEFLYSLNRIANSLDTKKL